MVQLYRELRSNGSITSKLTNQFQKNMDLLNDWLCKLISSRKQQFCFATTSTRSTSTSSSSSITQTSSSSQDVLSIVLEACLDLPSTSFRRSSNNNNNEISNQELRNNLHSLFVEGSEAIAHLATTCIYLLGLNIQAQRQARNESQQGSEYLNWVIYESFRISPPPLYPTGVMFRETSRQVAISPSGLKLPINTVISIDLAQVLTCPRSSAGGEFEPTRHRINDQRTRLIKELLQDLGSLRGYRKGLKDCITLLLTIRTNTGEG